jgi:hypothetical protein
MGSERISRLGWLLLLLFTPIANAVPPGDTQGVVSAVRLRQATGGTHSFEIWFSSTSRDRWGCIQSDGYILVSETAAGMTIDNYKRIFAIALAAQVAGKVLALDSAGTNPCTSANMAWMVD